MAEEKTLVYTRLSVNKWGISAYRVAGAPLGGTLHFSKNAFSGEPPFTVTVTGEGLQTSTPKAAKPAKEPRPPKEPKVAKIDGIPDAKPGESAATIDPPAPITEPEPVRL